jgi:hypothetical protein
MFTISLRTFCSFLAQICFQYDFVLNCYFNNLMVICDFFIALQNVRCSYGAVFIQIIEATKPLTPLGSAQ